MRRFKGNALVYFGHPDEELEDELNFGKSADLMQATTDFAGDAKPLGGTR
jgi:hypothetical protein